MTQVFRQAVDVAYLILVKEIIVCLSTDTGAFYFLSVFKFPYYYAGRNNLRLSY